VLERKAHAVKVGWPEKYNKWVNKKDLKEYGSRLNK